METMEALEQVRKRLFGVPHITLIGLVVFLATCVLLLRATHYNIAAIISISTFLAAIPMAITFALQTELQGFTAGITVRREGLIHEGTYIIANGHQGKVIDMRLRIVIVKTATSRVVIPYLVLLNGGYEVVDNQQANLEETPCPSPSPSTPSPAQPSSPLSSASSASSSS